MSSPPLTPKHRLNSDQTNKKVNKNNNLEAFLSSNSLHNSSLVVTSFIVDTIGLN